VRSNRIPQERTAVLSICNSPGSQGNAKQVRTWHSPAGPLFVDNKNAYALPIVRTVLYRVDMSLSFPVNVTASDLGREAKKRCCPNTIPAALARTSTTFD
jgi:hypothetical protein